MLRSKIRKHLAPVLLRRTRASVLQQLPPRINEIVCIPPSEEQAEIGGTREHFRVLFH